MAIRTITLEELEKMPTFTEEELKHLNSMKDEDIDFSDAPKLTEAQLAEAKPLRDILKTRNRKEELEMLLSKITEENMHNAEL